ncbi:hypothetical protein AKJ16_DCAP14576 [Drosera capensis]
MMSICFKLSPCWFSNKPKRGRFCCSAQSGITASSEPNNDFIQTQKKNKKKGFDVTVVEETVESIGGQVGLVPCNPDEVVIQDGFWYPYRNIFSIVDEIGIKPFTNWLSSAHYSSEGIEVVFPIFQDQPQLPTPPGTLAHTQFTRLPQLDLLTLLPLMAAVTARELLRQLGCSERLHRDVIDPLLEVRLFAPAEQCSAAATLAVLYYYVLAHQKDLDTLVCWGTVREKFFLAMEGVTEKGRVSALCSRDEFLGVLNLNSIDVASVKLQLDAKVELPKACDTGSGFNSFSVWPFFNLNEIYDEHENDPTTILQADFYANKFLPLSDEQIASKVSSRL